MPEKRMFIDILRRIKSNMSQEEANEIIEELKPFLNSLAADACESASLIYCDTYGYLDYRCATFVIDELFDFMNVENEYLRDKIIDYLGKRIQELR